jgi:hypothetical protein
MMDDASMRPVPAAAGVGVGLAGLALAGVGLWARRDVACALARERIVSTPSATPPSAPVTGAAAARSMAEVIRESTLAATGGRTYSETPSYVDADGEPTSDRAKALVDERTGQPVAHPDSALWVQATTLQSALMQAYMAFRLAELTVAIGGAFVLAGIGIASAGRR